LDPTSSLSKLLVIWSPKGSSNLKWPLIPDWYRSGRGFACGCPDETTIQQVRENLTRVVCRRLADRFQLYLRMLRRFVRVVNTGEILDLASPGFGVHSFGVTSLAFGQRGVDEYLNKTG